VKGTSISFFALLTPLLFAVAADSATFDENVSPFLQQSCTACHNSQAKTAGLALDFADEAAATEHPYLWKDVQRQLERDAMPPKGFPRPDEEAREAVLAWIRTTLEEAAANAKPEPGSVTVRRLNRAEYNNTIRDLFGQDLRPADDFPVDDSGYGFDNIGDVLTVSPVLMEKYLSAAGRVARSVVVAERKVPPPAVRRLVAPRAEGAAQSIGGEGDLAYSIEGRLDATFAVPATGDYELDLNSVDRRRRQAPRAEWMRRTAEIKAEVEKWTEETVTSKMVQERTFLDRQNSRAMLSRLGAKKPKDDFVIGRRDLLGGLQTAIDYFEANPEKPAPVPVPLPVVWKLDGKVIAEYLSDDDEETPKPDPFKLRLKAGEHRITGEILSSEGERWNPNAQRWEEYRNANNKNSARMIFIDSVEIKGPYDAELPPLPESHKQIVTCSPKQAAAQDRCAKGILSRLARRAYRRPVASGEVEKLASFVALAREQGAPFEEGLQTAIQAMLVSPNFLFRVEQKPAEGESVHTLTDYELASRLSYFLWASTPDEELLQAAARGELATEEGRQQQVRRMLVDEKSSALIRNFAGQWLQLRNLDRVTPDPEMFPEFNDALANDMRVETELFFESLMRENRSILDFLDARYTFLNKRLAEHYGIEGVEGPEFRKVVVDGNRRGGILSQASVLTVASYPTRTSPVLRGLWVLENILNVPPPPAPPDVPELDEEQVGISGSLRQQLEQHRANPACAVCHDRIDPLGFGLENYDPIGRWRDMDGKFAVDSSGELPGGATFDSPGKLKEILRNTQGDDFVLAVIEKMTTYALGRGVEPSDTPVIEKIKANMAANEYRFTSLVEGIVESVAFRQRSGEGVQSDD